MLTHLIINHSTLIWKETFDSNDDDLFQKIHMNIKASSKKHVQASYIKMKDNTTRTIDLRVVHLMLTFS